MRVALVAMETTVRHDTPENRRIERVAHQLAGQSHDVTLFCPQWWNDYTDKRLVDGVTYRGVTVGSASTSFAVRLPVLLARHRPDVVHTRPVPPRQVRAASIGSTLARAPLVVEWYGNEDLPDRSRSKRAIVTKPDQLITPSELVRTRVRELGADDDTVTVIPESIDYDRIQTVEPAQGVDVAYAHPLDETANIEDLLLGLAELRDRDWSATIIGDGPKREAYEQETADLRIDDRVSFVGACDRKRRLRIYRGAHAFVQTAYRECFATELLWALACGCVGVIQYQAESSAHELIENYQRSYQVTNPQQLADAIVDAGGFAHQTGDQEWSRFDHERIIEQYPAVYRDCREEFGIR